MQSREQPIYIQEVTYTAFPDFDPTYTRLQNPTGEYNRQHHYGPALPGAEKPPVYSAADTMNRLNAHIGQVMNTTADLHRKHHCVAGSNILHAKEENSLTRATTNEFFYYTQQPLSIQQFEQVMQNTMNRARQQPPNVHLALGTFAVETPDHRLMNVLPYIQCGQDPKLNLIVKNHPSVIDPVYVNTDPVTNIRKPVVNASVMQGRVDEYAINVDGKRHGFSYNSAIPCKTAGGQGFYSCYDICADHYAQTAQRSLIQRFDEARVINRDAMLPDRVTHSVVSNTAPIIPNHLLSTPTHVDPCIEASLARCDSPCLASVRPSKQQYPFGGQLCQRTFERYECARMPGQYAIMAQRPPPAYGNLANPMQAAAVENVSRTRPKLERTERMNFSASPMEPPPPSYQSVAITAPPNTFNVPYTAPVSAPPPSDQSPTSTASNSPPPSYQRVMGVSKNPASATSTSQMASVMNPANPASIVQKSAPAVAEPSTQAAVQQNQPAQVPANNAPTQSVATPSPEISSPTTSPRRK